MREQKVYEVSVTIKDPIATCLEFPELEAFAEMHIRKTYIGKCFLGSFIYELVSINRITEVEMNSVDLHGTANMGIAFTADVETLHEREIIHDCKFESFEKGKVLLTTPFANITIDKNKFTSTLGDGDEIDVLIFNRKAEPFDSAIVVTGTIDIMGTKPEYYIIDNAGNYRHEIIDTLISEITHYMSEDSREVNAKVIPWFSRFDELREVGKTVDLLDTEQLKTLKDGQVLFYDPTLGDEKHMVELLPEVPGSIRALVASKTELMTKLLYDHLTFMKVLVKTSRRLFKADEKPSAFSVKKIRSIYTALKKRS